MKQSVLKHGHLRRLRKLKIGRIKIWCCRCCLLAGSQIARAVHDGPVVARQLECLGALLFHSATHTHGGKAVLVNFELEVLNSFFFFSFYFICIKLFCNFMSGYCKIVVCFVLAMFSSNGFAATDLKQLGSVVDGVTYVVLVLNGASQGKKLRGYRS